MFASVAIAEADIEEEVEVGVEVGEEVEALAGVEAEVERIIEHLKKKGEVEAEVEEEENGALARSGDLAVAATIAGDEARVGTEEEQIDLLDKVVGALPLRIIRTLSTRISMVAKVESSFGAMGGRLSI